MVRAVFKSLLWRHDRSSADWAKDIVDKYDYDGDGRLSKKELILMTLLHNKKSIGAGLCKMCYTNIINEILNPIYFYIDCNRAGVINGESLFKQIKDLVRPNAKIYNMYGCFVNGKRYHTHATNDFILKNMQTFKGGVTRREFVMGLLLGYWDRLHNGKTGKGIRWTNKVEDVVCKRILVNNSHSILRKLKNKMK